MTAKPLVGAEKATGTVTAAAAAYRNSLREEPDVLDLTTFKAIRLK
jgi:hypothetical protein